MSYDFKKIAGTEGYVSPALDTTVVSVENGFCQSSIHDSFSEGDPADFFGSNN